ncbi:MAG TPA: 3'-5' exonuclease [Tepidiformaceae bacterium]|nr:3'-5' exonuclease [Tepidiformaceae bacterium]
MKFVVSDGFDLHAFLAPGVRAIDPTGRLIPAEERPTLDGAPALIVLDLEMSGANALVHEILDVGGVRAAITEGFPEERSWGSRVRPRRIGNAEIGALKVVGYNPRDWRTAIEVEAAVNELAELGRDAIVTGWGISGDLAFLAEAVRRLGIVWPFAPVALDVQGIAREVLANGEVDRFNLGHVADRLGIGRMGEHGALADAYATYDVLVKLFERARGR